MTSPQAQRPPEAPPASSYLQWECKETGHKVIRLKMQTTRGDGEGTGEAEVSFDPSQACQCQALAVI